MQDYNTIIGAIQMRLNKCPTRSVMDRFRIGSSTLNLIMSRYKALELTIDELEAMSPKEGKYVIICTLPFFKTSRPSGRHILFLLFDSKSFR